MIVFLDIETRSRADLPAVGAHRYGVDPSTEIFMAGVSTLDSDQVYLWVNPKFADAGVASEPKALELLEQATEVYAHNAPFEQALLDGTKFQPYVSIDKWRCTAAMARIAAIPDSLEKSAETLGLAHKKDRRGKALIVLFSIPKEDGTFNDPKDYPKEWAEFCEYCRQDVRVEKDIYRELSPSFPLKGDNLATFQFTLRMNDTGIPVNVTALRNAKRIIDSVTLEAREEFRRLTGVNITQREKVRQWLAARGLTLENMQAETLESVPRDLLRPEVERVLDLYAQLSYVAIKKVDSMLDWVCPDGRLHGVFKFYGAGTGRWTAMGPQLHNAKKPSPEMRPLTHQAYEYICSGGTAEGLSAVYGDPLEVIASCIRHFVDLQGPMLDADYNAIEARALVWLAGEESILNMWRKGVDLYKYMASQVYQKPVAHITKDERDMGKRIELGAGYSMGAVKFKATCDQYGVPCTDELAERAINTYRTTHPKVVALWRNLQSAAVNAINMPGQAYGVGGQTPVIMRCIQTAGAKYLLMFLPSGRSLAYRDPQLTRGEYGPEITYWGQLPQSTVWGRVKLYGGKICENIVQAIAADFMSFGARKAEEQWMLPFALIHDQALAAKLDGQTAEQFAAALSTLPPWAKGMPLKAESKVVPFYSK